MLHSLLQLHIGKLWTYFARETKTQSADNAMFKGRTYVVLNFQENIILSDIIHSILYNKNIIGCISS